VLMVKFKILASFGMSGNQTLIKIVVHRCCSFSMPENQTLLIKNIAHQCCFASIQCVTPSKAEVLETPITFSCEFFSLM